MTTDRQSPHYRHLEHPKTKAPDDFWGQVSRTVNGEPVSDNDINLIVTAIKEGLSLVEEDVVLDIGCGNGALSRFFYDSVTEFHGVDFSPYMIEVAKNNFEVLPSFSFQEADAAGYVGSELKPERFTKVMCYGVFSYLDQADAETVLRELSERFINVSWFYIGNLPDRDLASQFYNDDIDYSELLDDPLAAIGIWRSKQQLVELVEKFGWRAEFFSMPDGFYSSHYRYDVRLTRT